MSLYNLHCRLHQTLSGQICSLSPSTLNRLINASLRNNRIQEAHQLFDENPDSRNVISWNSIISGYLKNNQTLRARQLFDEMPKRDIVSWNTIISAYRKTPNSEGVYGFYLELMRSGTVPNERTFSIVISAVLGTGFNVLIPQLHAQIVRFALNLGVFVGSALIRGYIDLGDCFGFCKVFDEIYQKNATLWNVLILGYMETGLTRDAQRAFDEMPKKNIVSWTTMISGYLKNRQVNRAQYLFNHMSERNVVTWTIMISGFVNLGRHFDALELFCAMVRSGTQLNQFTYSSVLDACAECSSLVTGKEVHGRMIKYGTPVDIILSTSLVDMYAKCGDIEAAYCVFESMPYKNLASWNSIIGGNARNGFGKKAVEEFDRMIDRGFNPDSVTFVNVLSACAHGGLVVEGERIFDSMGTEYGVEREIEHCTCMVDLYGRAGHLEKAQRLIKEMPFEADVFMWGALLGACGLHSNSELGEYAAEAMRKLEKDHPACYSMVSKILGEKGAWNDVIELRNRMREVRARKQKAGSSVG